ncbi:MAG: DUF362 domain-containing protein [Myxococcales bacterium]|nr:DUF362 domain-containing protein [Myxococcales bacterium]
MERPVVIIRACPDYDTDRIADLVGEGLDTLGLRPFGRTLVKPNCVASGPHFPHAYTRPEFLEGVLRALKSRAGDDLSELALGERCGITMPTRFAFDQAHYVPMLKRVGAKAYHFDEVPQVPVPLYHPERLRDTMWTPEPVAKADFFVNCPKFKAHPWTTVTFSMKNYIGIQDDRHRLVDHDHRLNEKVADLQYIVQPQFIAIDAIIAGEGRMLTPVPFDLGLVLMGNNQVAFDAVCCRLIGLDPLEVEHIRMAHERGFGPVDLDAIDVVGDVSFAEAQARAQGFRTGLIRVEDYFAGTNIRAYSGPPPPDGGHDYCWGGCPGALEEAVEVLRLYDAATDEKMPPVHIVFGAYDGPIDAEPGEKVVFVGDCARFHGDVAGKPVQIESVYADRSTKDPLEAKYADIYAKMVSMGLALRTLNQEDVVRITGCPVSVAEQVLMLVKLGKLRNPYFDPKQAIPFTSCYLSWRTRQLLNKLMGQPYNVTEAIERGAARPAQNLPPAGASSPFEAG